GLADDQAVSFLARFELELESFVAEGNSGARIENRLNECILAQLAADFAQIRPKIDALPFDAMTGGAGNSDAVENLCAVGRIAFHVDQFGNRRQGLVVLAGW